MKNFYLLLLIFFLIPVNLLGQITFNAGPRATIFVESPTTGDQLRAFINTTPAAGQITDQDITFSADLVIRNAGTLTDNNAVYHFPGIFRYAPQLGVTVNFTDVTIHYTGNSKGNTYNFAYTANFNRVFYLQGVTGGRSDFFNNGGYTFNMNDVTLVSYGNDFLHFQTAQTLNNITIVNAQGGLAFEPGARNVGEVETINNLKLIGITRIVGGSGSNGDLKVFDLDWNATNWNFTQRNVDFFFVNPIKPVGWTGYSGTATRVKEYYTHNVTITDRTLNPLQNLNVLLYNINDTAFDYNLITNAQGGITTQEVLKIDNARGLNFDRGTSTLIVADYQKEYYTVDRVFNKSITDNIVINDDPSITQTNQVTVAGYPGITINHTAKTLEISSNHTLCEVYDFIKLNKLSNLTEPTIAELFVNIQDQTLNINDYQLILSGSAVITICDKFAKIESTVASNIADLGNLDIGLEDANGLFKLISISNIVNADVVITDQNTSNTITTETNFTGTSNTVTQLNSNQVRILITRDGFTTWSAVIDLSEIQDIYRFEIFQAPTVNPATVLNQEDMIYLAKKILQKNEGILKELNGTTPNVTVNNNTQPATINATEERQLQMLLLLKRILSKTTAVRKTLK